MMGQKEKEKDTAEALFTILMGFLMRESSEMELGVATGKQII